MSFNNDELFQQISILLNMTLCTKFDRSLSQVLIHVMLLIFTALSKNRCSDQLLLEHHICLTSSWNMNDESMMCFDFLQILRFTNWSQPQSYFCLFVKWRSSVEIIDQTTWVSTQRALNDLQRILISFSTRTLHQANSKTFSFIM